MKTLHIGVVGPCAAGKTTLISGLKSLGYHARHIAQEHSYVADMWKRISGPQILIFLDVSYPVTLRRRRLDWSEAEYQQECSRLRHARQSAHLYIHTDDLTPEQVLHQVVDFLESLS